MVRAWVADSSAAYAFSGRHLTKSFKINQDLQGSYLQTHSCQHSGWTLVLSSCWRNTGVVSCLCLRQSPPLGKKASMCLPDWHPVKTVILCHFVTVPWVPEATPWHILPVDYRVPRFSTCLSYPPQVKSIIGPLDKSILVCRSSWSLIPYILAAPPSGIPKWLQLNVD